MNNRPATISQDVVEFRGGVTHIEPRLRAISLGAGVQSTVLALMAARGEIKPMPDCAIFADTQAEPGAVYEHLAWLRSHNVLPFPVHVVSAGSLTKAITQKATRTEGGRFPAVPFFTETGIGRRQCTRDFKIEPIGRMLRHLLGYQPRQRIPAGSAEVWIGFTTDELVRAVPSRVAWQVNRWPLLEKRMSRGDCIQWLRRHEYPVPPKSACVFCPYRRNSEWRRMRNEAPQDFAEAVRIDDLIRASGTLRGMRSKQYIHDSRRPLREIDFDDEEDKGQLGFLQDCEGMCGL